MEVSLIVTLFLMNYFHCNYLLSSSIWCISPKHWSYWATDNYSGNSSLEIK